MIDRKPLLIWSALLLAMIAATLWRLSLFPDWQHVPFGNPAEHHSFNAIVLFAGPASLLIEMAVPFLQKWLSPRDENQELLRRWSGRWLVTWGVLIALLQAFVLARSLGVLSLSALGVVRVGLVWIGTIAMMMGNAIPKLPLPSVRSHNFQLDPWQGNQHLRFLGKLVVGMGLAFAVGGILLPPESWNSAFLCLCLAALAAGLWHRIKVQREPLAH